MYKRAEYSWISNLPIDEKELPQFRKTVQKNTRIASSTITTVLPRSLHQQKCKYFNYSLFIHAIWTDSRISHSIHFHNWNKTILFYYCFIFYERTAHKPLSYTNAQYCNEYIYIYIYIYITYNKKICALTARACQTITGVTSTIPHTEMNYYLVRLWGEMCQHVESPSWRWLATSELPLTTSSYPNFSWYWDTKPEYWGKISWEQYQISYIIIRT